MQTVDPPQPGVGSEGFLDKLLNFKIGPVPLPAYLFFAAIIFLAAHYGKFEGVENYLGDLNRERQVPAGRRN